MDNKHDINSQNNNLESKISELELMLKDAQDDNKRLKARYAALEKTYKRTVASLTGHTKALEELKTAHLHVVNSLYWKITAPLRFFVSGIKKFLRSNKLTRYPCKFIKLCLKFGPSYAFEQIRRKMHEGSPKQNYILSKAQRKKEEGTVFEKNIKFSVLVPLYNTPENFLREMIDSVQKQTYKNWELCLADGSDKEHNYVEKIVNELSKTDERILYKRLESNKGISENTNECIKMASGEYIALFDHDDLLHPSAFFEYMKAICNCDADFIYCDEDKFEEISGGFFDAHYKPDFAIDNLRANNYICHFSVFKRSLLESAGYFNSEFDGSQDHDIILRLTEKANTIVHIPKILYHWRVSKASVASDPYAKPYTIEAGKKAVAQHLERCSLPATVESSTVHPNIYRINYEIKDKPLISILIPNCNHIELLSVCIDSILSKSTYQNYEIIIIENNSSPETFDYYETLKDYPQIRVVVYETDGGFNYSAINNFGAKHAKGEHILLLNNDIEVISDNWLEEMLMFSQREDVGAVGAMLYYPDDTIQHAGLIMGSGGVAGHAHKFMPRGTAGYFGRAAYQQDLSGVTAACLMLRRSIFEEIGGLDESFAVAFNDVDLCLRIREKGYNIVWTPYAELYHYESISRGSDEDADKHERFVGEVYRFQKRWEKVLSEGDPYYNKNLSLKNDCTFQ